MVVRYGCFMGADDYEKMAPADNGAWVKYEYHIQRIAELEERHRVLVEALEELLSKFPKEKTDYSGVGWCSGCGALHWCTGNPGPREPCKPDCVLQKARAAIAAAKEGLCQKVYG